MNICLFSTDEINKPLSHDDERAIHLNKVLHKKIGDTFSAGIIGGEAGTATITATKEFINPKTQKIELEYEFSFKPETDGKPLFPLIMIIGFPRPIQLKRLLRDIAGLGVCQVHLTGTELGEKSYMQSTLVERGAAYQMLLDGTVQAASTHVPELFLHSSLSECLSSINSNSVNNNFQTELLQKAALDNISPKMSLQKFMQNFQNSANINDCKNLCKADNLIHSDKLENSAKSTNFENLQNLSNLKIVAAIGSERGWTNSERKLLEQNGFTLCSMGRRVLRTESAATVSASIILSNLGYLD